MADYIRIANDLAHPFVSLLSDANGPLDLESGCVVTFVSRRFGDASPTTIGLAQVVNPGVPVGHPQRGLVVYDPIAPDVAKFGIYFIRWQVVFPGNPLTLVQSFPEGRCCNSNHGG